MTRPLRILLFSTLYPSSARPGHGIFVQTRLRELLATGKVQARVVAPVPWFPSTHPRFGDWAQMAKTPRRETWHGIDVEHPRYLLPPKVGMNPAPLLMAASCLQVMRRLQRDDDFDLIDAHYYYPDGAAAALLARCMGKPFTVTARGSDLNLLLQYPVPRRWIRWTAGQAAASIGVCQALADKLAALGGPTDRLHVMRNGVDLALFKPHDRMQARAELGLDDGRWLLSVGNLVALKGHDIAITALTELADMRLAIVGQGGLRAELEQLALRLGVAERVCFVGAVPQAVLPLWYSAADALLLCSSREGWANVLLEAMACGTPVVATRTGGTPEVVQNPTAGRLLPTRTPAALASTIQALFADYPQRAAVREYAEQFSWEHTSQAQLALFHTIASTPPAA